MYALRDNTPDFTFEEKQFPPKSWVYGNGILLGACFVLAL